MRFLRFLAVVLVLLPNMISAQEEPKGSHAEGDSKQSKSLRDSKPSGGKAQLSERDQVADPDKGIENTNPPTIGKPSPPPPSQEKFPRGDGHGSKGPKKKAQD